MNYNPRAVINLLFAQDMNDRLMKDMVRIAWNISPVLAVYLPDRLRNSETIVLELTRLLRNNPEVKSSIHISQDLILLYNIALLAFTTL